jgi:hypothetical protein
VFLSPKAITKMRVEHYNHFVSVVTQLGRNVRDYWRERQGKEIKFASICHDIWNGYKKDILGVTLSFVDPRNCVPYMIPIGLVQTFGHTAVHVAAITKTLLQAFGFDNTDLCSSINDNTTAAVCAGKYILNNGINGSAKGGHCDMHKAELCLKHATGLVVRKRGGIVVDENRAFL